MERNARVKGILVIGVVCLLSVITLIPSVSQAKSRVTLSRTKKTYDMTGLWDKVNLKNVPSGEKISWRSSDKTVVKIKSRVSDGIWYQVCRYGMANIVATCRGRKYVCRIRVVNPEPETTGSDNRPTVSDNEDNDNESDSTGSAETSDQIVINGDASDQGDSGTAAGGEESPSEGEPSIYDRKISEFQSRCITDGMSDYDKMIAICEYLTNEFDYQPYQPSFETMIKTGSGDCMASRIGVYKLARLLGLRAFKCSRYEDHGRTMVRCGDQVYMTVTGFNVPQPRYYVVYEMTEEGLQNMKTKYNNCFSYLGLE